MSASTNQAAPQGQAATHFPNMNRMQVLRDETQKNLQTLRNNNVTDPDVIASTVIDRVCDVISIYNSAQSDKSRRWAMPTSLEPVQLAEILMDRHTIRRVSCLDEATESDYDLLAVYQEDGPEKGIYSTSDLSLKKLVNMYNPGTSIKQMREVAEKLALVAPRVTRCKAPNLVPVNNGIFDYDTKQLMPFSPDYVFLSKCRIDYVPNAVSPVIRNPHDGSDWEVEGWTREITGDPEVNNSVWEVIGASIRPNVPWNKAAWLYSEQGNNGKGTLCRLIRNLCGAGNHTSVPLVDFGKDFALESLIHVSAIINDENDVDIYIDRAANLKAVITGDVIQINRKFKSVVAYRFQGFMVQCINGMPMVKDKSDSFYRRQLIIPFTKNFEGVEKRYIKEDYLGRKEVLEYVLCRVLNMNYYELSEPAVCKAMLQQYKVVNDPVRQFLEDFEDQFAWDLLPYGFLYDLYLKWLEKNVPSTRPLGKTKFSNAIAQAARNNPIWTVPPRNPKDGRPMLIKTGKLMDGPEMLIKEYKLDKWKDDTYNGLDEARKYTPRKAISYRGLIRTTAVRKYGIKLNGGAEQQIAADCGRHVEETAEQQVSPELAPEPEM